MKSCKVVLNLKNNYKKYLCYDKDITPSIKNHNYNAVKLLCLSKFLFLTITIYNRPNDII